jgi:DNA topoisomerase VI subunit A
MRQQPAAYNRAFKGGVCPQDISRKNLSMGSLKKYKEQDTMIKRLWEQEEFYGNNTGN